MLLTGKQVKEMAAREGWLLVKFLPLKDLKGLGQNNFQYKYGLNVPLETADLSLEKTCGPGGLYFTYLYDDMNRNRWVDDYAYHITIPDDASVVYYRSEDKFKTDQLVIEKPWAAEEYERYIKFRAKWLKYLVQTPELCLAAIRYNSYAMYYVEEQTPELCLAAVQECSYALRYIKEQTPELCLAAVRRCGYSLSHVKNQTPKICLAAVQQTGYALQYVKVQTPKICLAAVRQNGLALEYVQEQTPKICLVAVYRNGDALKYVKEQTPEILAAAGVPPPDPRC